MTGARPRLLLVEDDRRVGSFIAHGLRDEGFDVDWATTGEDAQTKIGNDVDLVLLDHMLPRKSGIDVLRSFRAEGRTVPILMLTARDAPDEQRAAFAAGANAFMSKPFLFDELVEQIRRLIPNAA